MARQIDTAWHRKVGLQDNIERQADGAMELIELQDAKRKKSKRKPQQPA
jgi:hypothetical protein